jgi:hypothetical protein
MPRKLSASWLYRVAMTVRGETLYLPERPT